jgi:hypothetical protein
MNDASAFSNSAPQLLHCFTASPIPTALPIYSMPSSGTRTNEIWKPHELFELYNPKPMSFSCKGSAATCKRRCHNVPASRSTVNGILDRLSMQEPDERVMYDDLLEAAELSCCRRWHQGQAEKIAADWYDLVKDLRWTRRAPRTEAEPRIAEQQRSATISTSNRRGRGRRTLLETPSPTFSTEQDSRTVSPARSTISPSVPSTSFSIPSTTSTTSTSSLDSVDRTLSTVHEQVHAPQAELDRLQTERCSPAHAIRRPLLGDCAICYEGLSDTALGNLVWCKSQCGNSVHKECWEHWSRESTSRARCVHW